jgi:hypothetical protein
VRPVTVNKLDLAEKIKANRDQHRTIFEEALAGYREEAMKVLAGHIAALKSGKPKRVQVYLPFPEDHTDDYDAALGMLEISVDNTVELDETAFRQLVLNEWSWTKQFLNTNAGYSRTAASMVEED